MSENEDARLGGATAQCVDSTEWSFYQREVWEGVPAAVVVSVAHSQVNSRSDCSSTHIVTQILCLINQVNHRPSPNSDVGESGQQPLVTDGGRVSLGDGVDCLSVSMEEPNELVAFEPETRSLEISLIFELVIRKYVFDEAAEIGILVDVVGCPGQRLSLSEAVQYRHDFWSVLVDHPDSLVDI